MASSGTINNTFRTGYAVRIVWSVTAQSVANNTSTVTASVQLVSLGSSYTINSSATKNGSLTVNGTKYDFTFNAALTGNQAKTIYTKTGIVVNHNANGTKTCSFSCSAGINVTLSGTYYSNVTASGSGVFNTIARASTISSVTGSVSMTGSNAVTVNITRAVSTFTHTVVFSFGSYTNTQNGIGTSASYTIPMTWINALPNGTSGTAKVTVTTYSGSTKIGSSVSKDFTVTVPSSVVPSIGSVSLSEAVSGLAAQFQGYVQNKSKLAVSVTATGIYSSTIKAYRITVDGTPYTSSSFTSGLLNNSGSRTVSIDVTDSRGRSASTTRTITVIAYAPPAITALTGFRSNADGSENYEGTRARIAAAFTVSSVGGKNINTHKFEYKLESATSWTSLSNGTGYSYDSNFVTGSVFGADSSFHVRLSVTDYFGTITKTIEIPTAFTLMDFNASGRGIAFGKVSELSEGVEFGIPVTMNTPLPIGSGGHGANNAASARSNLGLGSSATKNISQTGNSNQDRIAYIAGDGVMEIGKYIDFHNIGSTADYDYRLTQNGGDLIFSGSASFGNRTSTRNNLGFGGKVLWQGGMLMTAGHLIYLSENVQDQPNGISLVFSRYSSGTVQDYHFNHFFVPKIYVQMFPGFGNQFLMSTDGLWTVVASKYLYINNDRIGGSANNSASGTANGITYNNAGFVLRYVIGV